jgi:hypothetical protein
MNRVVSSNPKLKSLTARTEASRTKWTSARSHNLYAILLDRFFPKGVEDSKEALKQMQSNVKATVLQLLINLVFRADTDGNLFIDDDEASHLVRRIQNVPGANLDEAKLQAAISGKSFDSVLVIIDDLLQYQGTPTYPSG